MINEKELYLEFLDEDGVYLTLMALGENPKNGTLDFKRMKIRQILTKKQKKNQKMEAWAFLCDKLKVSDLEGQDPNEMIDSMDKLDPPMPNAVRLINLMYYHREFVAQNEERIRKNIEKKCYFLSGLGGVETDEQAKEKILKQHQKLEMNLDKSILKLIDLFTGQKKRINEFKIQVKNNSLVEIHNWINGNAISLEDNKNDRLWIQLAYLSVADIEYDVKKALFWDSVRYALRLSIIQVENLEKLFQEKDEFIQQLKLKHEKELKKIKKTNDQLLKNEEMEKKELEYKLEKLQLLEEENQELTKKVKRYEILTQSYERNISTHYDDLKIVVVHTSYLVYMKTIFPDITFIISDNLAKLDREEAKLVLIQEAVPYSKKHQLKQWAKINRFECLQLQAKDEREMIIELSILLGQKGEQK